MNLKSIEYFLCAAEEMNITRAAERLFISQQALSSHIKRLEDDYNVRLFERHPSLRLTPEGQEMVFYGQQILKAQTQMRAAFSDINKDCRATLYVGISRFRANAFFPLIWKLYHPSHPNISIELVSEKLLCCFSETLLETYYPDRWQDMMEEMKDGVDLLQLKELPFITTRPGNRLRQNLDQFLARQFKPRFLLESDQQELCYQISRNGDGLSILSPTIFYQHRYDREAEDPRFHIRPIRNDIPENTVYLVFRRNQTLPRYAADFSRTQAWCSAITPVPSRKTILK